MAEENARIDDESRKLASRIINRYMGYAAFILEYSNTTQLQLNEKQASLLERAIADELIGKTTIPSQEIKIPNKSLNEEVDREYMKSLTATGSKTVVSRMLNILFCDDRSPIKNRGLHLKNEHLLEAYKTGRDALSMMRDWGSGSYELLEKYLKRKGLLSQ